MKAPIVLAVDTSDLETAKRWVEATHESVSVYKLGLEFFLNFGQAGVSAIQDVTDSDIFLDLKLHDIPHTVAGAASAVKSLSPRFLTVHASGGKEMVAAAVGALPGTSITAVTILTSLSEEDLFEIGYANNALESAVALAKLSVNAGAKAIVCSPLEIASIRSAIGPDIEIITPGVRPLSDAKSDDQKRTMTPVDAITAGASLLVIGRPITGAWKDGAAAMSARARSIADEILK
ncbi:PyrF Orotidine-5'-phosphate decarboxylase [Candidatus Nanopelagicaceae bacterium]